MGQYLKLEPKQFASASSSIHARFQAQFRYSSGRILSGQISPRSNFPNRVGPPELSTNQNSSGEATDLDDGRGFTAFAFLRFDTIDHQTRSISRNDLVCPQNPPALHRTRLRLVGRICTNQRFASRGCTRPPRKRPRPNSDRTARQHASESPRWPVRRSRLSCTDER
jgi:hypothetical protein